MFIPPYIPIFGKNNNLQGEQNSEGIFQLPIGSSKKFQIINRIALLPKNKTTNNNKLQYRK
jgi:hypothetical protein